MPQIRWTHVASIAALSLLLSLPSQATINKSIRIDEGETVNRNLGSVNGSIRIGRNATVKGHAETVNGAITIRDGASVRGAETVNGAIRIGTEASLDGDVETVNGAIKAGSGTRIEGDVETVNGGVELLGTKVTGNLHTRNGSVRLKDGSRVQGNLVVEKVRSGWFFGRKSSLKIYIDGAIVGGDVVVKDSDRDVQVILSGGGKVEGQIRGAEVVRR